MAIPGLNETEGGLQIRLFGSMQVEVDGEPLRPLRARRGLWLLALLTLRANREVTRAWLAGTLWPDSDDGQALSNLKRTLTDLRTALNTAAPLLQSPSRHTLLLALPPQSADVLAFDAAVAQRDTPASLLQAIALYTAPLLEDCYELWAAEDQASRKEAFLVAVERLATMEAAPKQLAERIEILRRAVRMEPSRENLTRLLMEALVRNGEAAAATEAYRALRVLLLEEFRCAPAADITALYTTLHTQPNVKPTPAVVPPVGAAVAAFPLPPPTRNVSLPRAVTELIGRKEEVRDIRERLENCALLTLTGAGGMGKTRLAVESARQSQANYPEGVRFVDLAPLGDPTQLVQTVVACLGIREEAGRSLSETLTTYLQPRHLLLILDNCEHLLDACADLATQLLRDCPALRILTTSRQSLGVLGEVTYAVPALETPPSSLALEQTETDKGLIAVLMEYEAVRLFVERAQSVSASFRLTTQNASTVIEICRHLDGIPLAIELASVRLNSLSVEDILHRLADRFRLLTSGNRSALPHHKTLRSMMDWSYGLLTDKEKILLQRLAVFAGGWTLEGAEQVCAFAETESLVRASVRADGENGEIRRDEILDLLTSLADKSLVSVTTSDTHNRFHLLETIRQYATEKLEASGETNTARSRHGLFLLRLAETTQADLMGAREVELLGSLEEEHDNLRAALHWSLSAEETGEFALSLCSAWGPFWNMQDNISEGSHWCRLALDKTADLEPDAVRIAVLTVLSRMGIRLGNFALAHAVASETLLLAQRLEDQAGICSALYYLGSVAWRTGDFPASIRLLTESLALARQIGDRVGIVSVLNVLAIISRDSGDYALALEQAEESLRIARAVGRKRTIAQCLNILGSLISAMGEAEKARPLLEEGLALQRELHNRSGIMSSLYDLGIFESRLGNHAVGQLLLDEALELSIEIGEKVLRVHLFLQKGLIAWYQNDFVQAERWAMRGLTAEREKLTLGERTVGLYILALVAREQADYARATTLMQECVSTANQNEENNMIFACYLLLSSIAYLQQENAIAEAFLCEGMEVSIRSGHVGDIGESIDALEAFACLSSEKGERRKASCFLAEAEKLRAQYHWVSWRWRPDEALRTKLLEQWRKSMSRSLCREGEEMSLRQAFALFQQGAVS